MSVLLTINGNTYNYPEPGDQDWGSDATDWSIAVTNGMLQKAGGLFQLLSEVDFGTSFGIKSLYYVSRTSNPSSTGSLRLANTDFIGFRNAGNTDDLELGVDTSNNLTFNGIPLQNFLSVTDTATINLTLAADVLSADIINDSITNAMINSAAAIAYSKLNLSNSIVNADINSSAAIAYSKLNLSNSILNADINSSAAIAYSKLAALNNNIVPVSNGSGVITSSSVTATELGYLSGVTSSIQTQLNAKVNNSSYAAKGDILVATGAGTYVAVGVGTNGDVLTANSAQTSGVQWLPASGGSGGAFGAGTTIDDDYSVTVGDNGQMIWVETSVKAIEIELPDASTVGTDFSVTIKDIDGSAPSNNITIVLADATDLLDNVVDGTKVMSTAGVSLTIVKKSANEYGILQYAATENYIVATGGTITTVGNRKIHTFTSSSNFVITSGEGNVDYLVIGGGAGGGHGNGGGSYGAGGGGAGGYIEDTALGLGAGSYTITIGAGGAGGAATNQTGFSGGSSSFDSIDTALGGGGGGWATAVGSSNGVSGASGGGGGGASSTGGTGTVGQGNNGGSGSAGNGGAGGGGAGAVGSANASSIGGAGGAGTSSSITGSAVTYAGGGGGGSDGSPGGAGGTGGGGAGGISSTTGTAGTANTGGGGGAAGGGASSASGGAGGSGIIILSYQFQG